MSEGIDVPKYQNTIISKDTRLETLTAMAK